MTDLLGIGASGISAYRAALTAIGENVSNADTPGFARRTVCTRESAATGSSSPLYLSGVQFGGVETTGVGRAWSDYQAAEARISAADDGRADARMRWLSTAETAIQDGDDGAGAKLTAFFNSADALAGDPGNAMSRSAMLSALDDAAGAIRTSADGLARAANGIATEAQGAVDGASADLSALAKVNLAIQRAGNGTSAQASLLDERDRLIDDLSSKIAVDTSIAGDGTATITLSGNAAQTLLSGADAATLSLRQADDGRLSILATYRGQTGAIAPTGGAIAGLADAAATVAGRRSQLDSIAADFAATINGWNANGRTPDGTAGGALLSISGGASTLTAITTDDPDSIAAASSAGAANGNLLALQPLRAGGAETRLGNLVANHAQMVASATSEAAAASTRKDSAFAARDATSGVDLDREAAELLRYQQAYNASAKIVQVARETLQQIFDLF